MHNVYLYSGCYTLSPNADINWYTEKLGKQALLSEDDFVTYAADKNTAKMKKSPVIYCILPPKHWI